MRVYDVTWEISVVFIQDLLRYKYLPIFDLLLDKMRDNLTHYEMKLTVLQRLMPLMNSDDADKFMKTFDDILDNPAEGSIFRMNVNPLRIGLMLYKTLDDIMKMFGYSAYCTAQIKDKVINQIITTLKVFNDPDEMIPLMEIPDVEGKDIIWYFHKFELFQLLDAKVMDKFIN